MNHSTIQWELFVENGIIFTEEPEHIYIGQHNVGGGDCFYLSILQNPHVCPPNISTVTELRQSIWSYVNNNFSECKDIHNAFVDSHDKNSFQQFVDSVVIPRTWACTRIICITSLFLQVDIIVVSNEVRQIDGSPWCGLFRSSEKINDFLGYEPSYVINPEKIYLYHHLFNKPLQPAPLIELNHFCSLIKRNRNKKDYLPPNNINNHVKVFIVNNGCNKDFLHKMEIRRMNAITKASYRSDQSPEQILIELEKANTTKKNKKEVATASAKKAKKSPEQKLNDLKEYRRMYYLNLTKEKRAKNLERQRELYAQRLANETHEQTLKRQQLNKEKNKKLLANETPEEKAKRLEVLRRNSANLINNETHEQTLKRQQLNKEKNKKLLANETPEEKAKRLEVLRRKSANLINNETPEEYFNRLEVLKENSAKIIANETPQEYVNRLEILRINSAKNMLI